MTDLTPISEKLIAPCGMNCAICSRYLSYINGLKRSQCSGCRTRNADCAYLFVKCTGINNNSKTPGAPFCFECSQFPCKQLKRMDDRYRSNYHMSVIANLLSINEIGVQCFVEEQYKKYQCSTCGGLISIHNRKCFKCDSVTRLIQKKRIDVPPVQTSD